MSDIKKLNQQKLKRRKRIRGKLSGTATRPRLTVFRSNAHINLQVVDDASGQTLFGASDMGKEQKLTGTKTQRAVAVAALLLVQLKKHKIEALVFDRAHYKYHGRIKAVADALREGGIKL